MWSYIMSEGSRVKGACTPNDTVKWLKKWSSVDLRANTYVTPTFQLCVCNFIFPLPVYGIPYEYFRESPSLSLSLHLLLFLYCCVAPGNTVMCPPSVPPSLSLSLCPCHLQLLCETRHTAWGREAWRVGEIQGTREERKREKKKERQLYRQRKQTFGVKKGEKKRPTCETH